MFVFHTLPYGLPSEVTIYETAPRTTAAIGWVRRGLNLTAIILFLLSYTTAALFVLLASTVIWLALWAIVEKVFTGDIKPGELGHLRTAWGAAHIGGLNWVFDIPGRNCGKTQFTHAYVILANLVGGIAVTIAIFTAPDLARAWGCYRDTPIKDMNSGLCAPYFDICPGESHQCPDFSRPVCLLETTQQGCGITSLNSDIATGFEPYLLVAAFCGSTSLAVYALSLTRKVAQLEQSAYNSK